MSAPLHASPSRPAGPVAPLAAARTPSWQPRLARGAGGPAGAGAQSRAAISVPGPIVAAAGGATLPVMENYILTLRCTDQPGIVRSLAEGIVRAKGNILESAQFSDPPTGLFCLRTCFESPEEDIAGVRDRRRPGRSPGSSRCSRCGLGVAPPQAAGDGLPARPLPGRPAVPVGHRARLPADLRLVVSNHEDCRPLAERYGLPYVHIPVTAATKPQAERRAAGPDRPVPDRGRRAGPVHAGALRRSLPRAGRPGHQHPPLLPAGIQGSPALPPGLRRGG